MRASADFTIFFDETKAHDAKCWAVNWSCNSHYAMASFSRKSRKKNESGKLISTIQVYDSWCNRLIQKIDSNSVPIELNQFIYIIEPHPFKDNIAFTADYDGKVVLWDIEQGLILNIFFERGSFFNSPTLELPCLDGRFSPDGFSFSVATYYGTFSIYGYGVRDPYDYTPIEQFYLTDHKRFEFDEIMRIIDSSTGLEEDSKGNGKLCNILRNEYPKQPRNIMDILMKNGYFRSNFGQSGLEGFEKLTLENEENNSSCNNFILEKEETNVGELAGDIEKEYENLLFFQHQVFSIYY